MSEHDNRCASRKGFPCNCALAAIANLRPYQQEAMQTIFKTYSEKQVEGLTIIDEAHFIKIDDNVRIPRPKGQVKREQAERKVFRAYADAYERVYVRRPVLNGVTKSGFFQIDVLPQAVNAKRLKELTGMLKERAKDL